MNFKLTPQECVDTAMRKVDDYRERGVCVMCAVNLTASDYEVAPERIEDLYLDYLLRQITDGPQD